MPTTPFIPGQTITEDFLLVPVVHWVELLGGPTSGGTELIVGTVTVPPLGVPTVQIPSAHWNGNPDANGADDRWRFLLRDTNTSGTIRGFAMMQTSSTSAQDRLNFAITAGTPREVMGNVSATYVATIQRAVAVGTGGTITFAAGNPGQLTVLCLPNP